MAGTKRTNDQILADDARISELYLMGWTQVQIAKEVSISQPTVSRAISRIHDRWMKSSLVDFHEAKMRHLQQLEYVFQEAQEAWEASKGQRVITSKSTRAIGGVAADVQASQRKEDSNGDPRFLGKMIESITRQAEILGYKQHGDINITENNQNVLINADRLALVASSAEQQLDDWESERFE